MKTLTANIEETLIEWFGSHSLEIKDITVYRDSSKDEPRLDCARGEFYPVAFDPDEDGAKKVIQYQLELALLDERFENTKLEFTSDTTFKIV